MNLRKVIKEFKLLDDYRGRGTSESLSVGIHTPELPAVEWMEDDVQSEIKTEFTSFYDGKVSTGKKLRLNAIRKHLFLDLMAI